jgi:hydroxymethylbilane synthase
LVAKALAGLHPGLKIKIVPIRTSGDDPSRKPTGLTGVKGLFVKEIEEALLQKTIDLAVHSAKDLPGLLPPGLMVGAVPERLSPFDALVSDLPSAKSLADLPTRAVVGTSSLRRRAQIAALRPDLRISLIRGNLDTRLKKMKSQECHAVILAAAGILRLKGGSLPFSELSPDEMLPAPGQGVLALERRADDSRTADLIGPLGHSESETALAAERGFMMRLGAGCQTPAAAWARHEGGFLKMDALVCGLDGAGQLRAAGRVSYPDSSQAAALGAGLADDLLRRGGAEIIAKAESEATKEWEA